MEITYTNYAKEYESRVVSLLNICFPGKHITSSSFLWKHFDNSFEEKPRAMVALDGETVCSFVCFTPLSIHGTNGTQRFFSCSVQATHPLYRRKGLVSILTKLIEKNLGDACQYLGFSNHDGVQIDLHSKTINYQILGQLSTQYILPNFLLRYKMDRIYNLHEIAKYKTEYSFFEIEKNFEYLDWRYIRHPKSTFRIYKISSLRGIHGYVLLRISRFKCEILNVCCNDLKSIYDCLVAVANFSYLHCIFIVPFTNLPNPVIRQVFPRFSFGKNINLYFTVKSRNKIYLDSTQWMIQGGDIQ